MLLKSEDKLIFAILLMHNTHFPWTQSIKVLPLIMDLDENYDQQNLWTTILKPFTC